MFYRENGQFKTNYRSDQQIFPVRQDRLFIFAVLALAFIVVPLLASDYFLKALLIPFLILSLAAIGLNILVGYCGQISLGTGAFMAVGAYAAWNIGVRFPQTPLIIDAGLGAPSHAAAVMELGYDGVLLNTAVARAGDPSAMARAFSLGIEAGRAAFFAKIITPRDMAESSTPALGRPFDRLD